MKIKNLYKIVIWGTGNTAKKALQYLSENVEIVGFCDNNFMETLFNGYKVLDKNNIKQYDYDYVVICSIYYEEIYSQLVSLGVDREKILVWDYQKSEKVRIYKADFLKRNI